MVVIPAINITTANTSQTTLISWLALTAYDEAANYGVPLCRRFISRRISQTQAEATATSINQFKNMVHDTTSPNPRRQV